MSLRLEDLAGCFEGVVPSKIATCSAAGIPNASYLSHVHFVDPSHVATSFQFFNKTRANLLENPHAVLQVRHPSNLQPYTLRVRYVRSETSGALFDQMSVRLDVIAAHEGMGPVFQLKAADVFEVLSIEKIPGRTTLADSAEACEDLREIESLRVISEKLNQSRSMEELMDQALALAHRHFGFSHLILLLKDPDGLTLTTHGSFGYGQGGVGSEVRVGEGLIGVCAQTARLFQVSSLREGTRYARAAQEKRDPVAVRIPLPGLAAPASQIAAPLLVQGELLGVLAAESETVAYWTPRQSLRLSLVANHLALGLAAFTGLDEAIAPPRADFHIAAPTELRFRFVAGDELIFVNDRYLIKNVPAKILRYLLDTHLKSGRREFSNIELRSEASLGLPDFKDNLEARLILLKKRLLEQKIDLQLVTTGRGRFRLETASRLVLER